MQFQDKASNCKSASGIEELQKWESLCNWASISRKGILILEDRCAMWQEETSHGDKMWKIDWHQNNTQKGLWNWFD